ncbi:ATP-binding protein [Cyclobacterium marinum]|uniref:ATP-binding protein n=1 Tax=Cyclobacterium marinum TaxID=104 RepID=UPI0011EE6B15|nr:ATP-binding protein [Cyclobacterium marinum]MBI0400397.1 AAA family ATPase [Cyclobacterium marinum]
MERIEIKDFGGLKKTKIDINKINLFICKQASGKSVSIKLMYYFKSFFRDFYEAAEDDKTKPELTKLLITKFEEYFPIDSWADNNFEITFHYNKNEYSKVYRTGKSKIKLELSTIVSKQFINAKRLIRVDKAKFQAKDKFEVYRPDFRVFEKYISLVQNDLAIESGYSQIFIPAGRSFFATLQSSIFSFLSNNKAIDPFLVSFGSFYENIKGIASRDYRGSRNSHEAEKIVDELIIQILGGKYQRVKNKDYIIHEDKRRINLAYASSGQQETLPLALILKALTRISFSGNGLTLYIEEPEAHLFPSAQKKIVELISSVFTLSRCQIQIILTTHSPYIISSFNNLLQAGLVIEEKESNKEKIDKIFNSLFSIPSNTLNAFALENQNCISILDKEYELIDSYYLDKVSDVISSDFDNLLNLG